MAGKRNLKINSHELGSSKKYLKKIHLTFFSSNDLPSKQKKKKKQQKLQHHTSCDFDATFMQRNSITFLGKGSHYQ